ncbi:S8 family peptidase [Deinococcus roseus]|uniref:Peptidase S8 n=1 Tax=Deinococcus roseus TaxID=392414 RepID=A0ABQ2CVK5_9DEIO|nr:S8 family peptidase [Deinococcus roseus]GGJ20561.1 hypothetical protein GCM10008938_03570 [Deinococcus roseus]
MRKLQIGVVVLTALLAACSSSVTPSVDTAQSMTLDSKAEFVPGEVIVKFKENVSTQGISKLGVNASVDRTLSGGEVVLKLDGVSKQGLDLQVTTSESASGKATLAAIEKLRAHSNVEYAEPNFIMHANAVPNDTYYAQHQWDMRQMNLPNAWNVTTGVGSPVVAVIDTGKTNHPDLAGRWVTGYDFISSATAAKDGNGRDSDPTDVGDGGVCNGSNYPNSWHGTHVAGTIGAATNNNLGVAGVNWNARISALRVLGKCGGTTTDIADSIRWAAGISVAGVPTNPNPAKVISMSLGAYTGTSCPSTYQSAINDAVARGVTVVIAAGNDNKTASGATPANCANVIAVAATRKDGGRAWYSNYGTTVDIAAPGGETDDASGQIDRDGDGYVDGILSTLLNSTGSSYNYTFYQGTSMATPHVSGLVSLMYAVKPTITPAQVETILKNTAKPITHSTCNVGCGKGLVDAYAAVNSAKSLP